MGSAEGTDTLSSDVVPDEVRLRTKGFAQVQHDHMGKRASGINDIALSSTTSCR